MANACHRRRSLAFGWRSYDEDVEDCMWAREDDVEEVTAALTGDGCSSWLADANATQCGSEASRRWLCCLQCRHDLYDCSDSSHY